MKTNKRKQVKDNIAYYFSVIFPIAVYFLFIFYILSRRDVAIDSFYDDAFIFLKMVWLAGVLMIPMSFISWIFLGSPLKKDNENIKNYRNYGWNKKKKLIVTYVSRGDNAKALERSVVSGYKLLKRMKVDFEIEVVTDICVKNKLKVDCNDVNFFKVPIKYCTVLGAKYKARALHYAIKERKNKFHKVNMENVWIFHLDEESVLTPQVIAGISKFISNPQNNNVIGQGEIKYNAYGYFKNILIGAIDSVRTGDDLGRFRFQFKILKMPLVGMHGSFMLVPAVVEHKIGFDLGGHGSITEDAYFALLAYDMGYKFGWVDGFIREQSPFNIKDLIKQRRRWFCGLAILAFDDSIAFKRRFYLICSLLLWKISWMSIFVTVANFLIGGSYFPLSLIILSAVMTSGYFVAYMVGVYRNLMDVRFSIVKKIFLYFITFILVPVSAFIEGIAVIYSILKPVKGFDVVKK